MDGTLGSRTKLLRRPLIRGQGSHGESVDLALHLVRQNSVNHSLGLQTAETHESIGNDGCSEVPPARTRTGVARVQVALVLDFDVNRSQSLAEFLLDSAASTHL